MMGLGFLKRYLFVTLPAITVLFLVTGCGSGGGGGGGDTGDDTDRTMGNSSLNSDYRMGSIGVDSARGVWSDQFDITFNGSGEYSGDITGTYSVQSDGVLTAGGETGQVSQDGSLFHLVDTTASDSSISIGIRKGSGMSVADLSGTYQVFFIAVADYSTYALSTYRYSIIFTGVTGTDNFSYTNLTASETGNGTYTVDSTGTLDIAGNTGQVSADGDVFFFASGTRLAIGVKQSTGMSTSDVTGTYHAVDIRDSDNTDDVIDTIFAGRCTISPDGTGNVTITRIDPASSPSSGTITVNNDGSYTTGTSAVIGQISPDTGFFVLVDDDTIDMDDDYQFAIGILKP